MRKADESFDRMIEKKENKNMENEQMPVDQQVENREAPKKRRGNPNFKKGVSKPLHGQDTPKKIILRSK